MHASIPLASYDVLHPSSQATCMHHLSQLTPSLHLINTKRGPASCAPASRLRAHVQLVPATQTTKAANAVSGTVTDQEPVWPPLLCTFVQAARKRFVSV